MILYTGGKTGGHIVPLINLINESNEESIYVGYEGYLEEKLCKANNIEFIGLPKHNNKYLRILKGLRYLTKKLKKLNIKSIVSSGGFVSTPLILYAIIHKIPFYLLEENLIIGKFNEFFYKFSKGILLAHPLEKMKKKYIYTGIPMKEIRLNNTKNYDILVIGGSLGSKPLCDIAEILSSKYKVLLVAGRYKDEYKENLNLDIINFSNDLYSLIANSKFVISRAGAMTTYEVMYLNVPLLIIPSETTKRNHQVINAEYLNDKGLAICLRENIAKERILDWANKFINDINFRIEIMHNQREYVIKDSNERIRMIINGI